MEIAEVEDLLVERLAAPSIATRHHLFALNVKHPTSLSDITAIGIDTNILKALRRDTSLAERFFVTLGANDVTLIAPSQCVIEYWNNHKVFANDEWNVFKSDLAKLTKRLESDDMALHEGRTVSKIQELVGQLSDDLEESRSPEYLMKSRSLMQSLLESAVVPAVSRSRFEALAEIRHATKTPPGWADEKTKSSALGDFFGWCDFLLGVLSSDVNKDRGKYLFVTDDAKPDWKTGTQGHPSLIAEFHRVCDGALSIVSLEALRALVDAAQLTDATGDAELPPTSEISDAQQ